MYSFGGINSELKNVSQTPTGSGVSFAKKELKLNSEDDALAVVEAIEACPYLEYLDLEGNTLGPDAAKAVAEALKKKGAPLKRALWKDMFTGRSKAEIPKALNSLGTALCLAGTQLVELDLSDNAFGPIGVEGLATFLKSKSCYTLRELRLNNNGLGISGGTMLAKALSECHANSAKSGGSPLALKVFIAGRNRLENDGAKALAAVFKKFKSLEEVSMPQNGIYHVGIAALADGLSYNPGLKILDLNDNTVGPKGAKALAKVLPNFQNLEELNLGDCLLRTRGCLILCEVLAIKDKYPALAKLNLTSNEIYGEGAVPIAAAVADKKSLISLQLDSNYFGSRGREILLKSLENSGRAKSVSLVDDESGNDSDEDEEQDVEDENSEREDDSQDTGTDNEDQDDEQPDENGIEEININVSNFLAAPSADKLLLLSKDNLADFIKHAKNISKTAGTSQKIKFAEEFTRIVVLVSSFCDMNVHFDALLKAESLTDVLYSQLCIFAANKKETALWSNALLVNLGLIKSEDKQSAKIDWSLEGAFKALEKVSQQEYFLPQLRDMLKVFLKKPQKSNRTKVADAFQQSKDSLWTILDRIQIT